MLGHPSDTFVATVSNGVVTAKGAGTATITVITADGGKTAECVVTVTHFIPGDVNSDGKVTRVDLLRLTKHFSGYDVKLGSE